MTKVRRRLLAGGALATALTLGLLLGGGPALAEPAPAPAPAVDPSMEQIAELAQLGAGLLVGAANSSAGEGNSSLGALTPADPGGTSPTIPSLPGVGGTNYLVGARPDYYKNLERMVASNPEPIRSKLVALQKVPIAQWIGGGYGITNLKNAMALGAAQNAVPVLVLYQIPYRDVGGGHSAGGAANAGEYRSWIDQVSTTIGNGKAVLILEPDALPDLSKLGGRRAERIELMAYAVRKLAGNPNARTYVDVGHPDYGGKDAMGKALRDMAAAGGSAQGVSVNTSNFYSTEASTRYGDEVLAAFGQPQAKMMVDVSRNGANPKPSGWCNPTGQKLGTMNDLVYDPNAHVEQMFIKTPGDSDGFCGIAPNTAAGSFNDQLMLHQLGVGQR